MGCQLMPATIGPKITWNCKGIRLWLLDGYGVTSFAWPSGIFIFHDPFAPFLWSPTLPPTHVRYKLYIYILSFLCWVGPIYLQQNKIKNLFSLQVNLQRECFLIHPPVILIHPFCLVKNASSPFFPTHHIYKILSRIYSLTHFFIVR